MTPLLAKLESSLPCQFVDQGDVLAAFLPGSETTIHWHRDDDHLEVRTPIEGAHDGLPAALLVDVLKLNFPNNEVGRSWVRLWSGGHYALFDRFQGAFVSPEDATSRILDQIRAAVELSEYISQQLRTRRA